MAQSATFKRAVAFVERDLLSAKCDTSHRSICPAIDIDQTALHEVGLIDARRAITHTTSSGLPTWVVA